MAKKTSLPANFTSKTNHQILPTVAANQKMNATTEWNLGIQDIADSIDENYERLPLNWTNDVIANQVLATGQRVEYNDVDYRCTSGYDVGVGITFTAGNFQVINTGVELNTWYISSNGDDTTGIGSPKKPFLTTQKAHDEASSGDVIWLMPGTDDSATLDITKTLTIRGHGAQNTRISGAITTDSVFATFVDLRIFSTILDIAASSLIRMSRCEVNFAPPGNIASLELHETLFGAGNSTTFNKLVMYNSTLLGSGTIVDILAGSGTIELNNSTVEPSLNSVATGSSWMKTSTIEGALTHGGDFLQENSTVIGTPTIAGTHTINNQDKELETIYVRKTGNNGNDGAESRPLLTISSAITAASSNDVINVGAGTFTEDLAISKTLTIIGVGRETDLTTPFTGIVSTITFTNDADLTLRSIYAVANLVESTSASHLVIENGYFFSNTFASSITDYTIKNSKQAALSGVFNVTGTMVIEGSRVTLPDGSNIPSLNVYHSRLICNDLDDAAGGDWYFYNSYCEGLLGNTTTTFFVFNSKFSPNSIRGILGGSDTDTYTIRRELTQAEMQALNSTPITLHTIGATSLGEVISIVVVNEYNTSAYGVASKLRFKYQISGTLIGETTASFVQASAYRAEQIVFPATSFEIVAGEDIIVDADADATGGNAATKVHCIVTLKSHTTT